MSYPTSKQLKERSAWAASMPACWVCGWAAYGGYLRGGVRQLETHEMIRRSQAPGRWCELENLFRACTNCHAEHLANVTVAPYARQLALKALNDSANFSLERFLWILNRGPEAVTQAEVDREIAAIEFGRLLRA